MKKWWVTVLVLTLALSLTSCSKKKKDTLQAGLGYRICDNSMDVGDNQTPSIGSFDVYIERSANNSGMFDLYMDLVQPAEAGDIVSVTIMSNSTGGYRQMIREIVLSSSGQRIIVGSLTAQDAEIYDLIAITPFDSTTSFAEQIPQKANFCYIPLVGDNTQVGDYTSTPQY